jgi:hypothetical protein
MAQRVPLSPEQAAMLQRLGPFVNLSALAASLLMTLVGLLFLVPLWLADARAATGGGVEGLGVLALPMFLLLYASSRVGIRRQLRPLAEVGAALAPALGEPRPRGRLRRGWGAALEFPEGVRVVAARGQGARPDLYLVRGEREFRFREPKRPLGELDEARRALGL